MAACIFELNDAGVRIHAEGGESLSSPGYALMQDDGVLTGEAARARARLQPLHANNRFWQRLGMEPLRHPKGAVRHHADLAYAHLMQLHELAGQPGEVVFAVPGNLGPDPLSVLLGIARHCPFRAVGLVDAAVAAAAGAGVDDTAVHVDLQLHQAVLTRLEVDGEITRDTVQTVQGAGLLKLYERWAHVIADAFIEQCRFDPLHSAATEQYLYDNMPKILAGGDQLIEVDLRQGGSAHQARVERAAMEQAGAELWQRVLGPLRDLDPSAERLLSHRWHGLPGIDPGAPRARLLPADAVAAGCRAHTGIVQSEGEGVRFVTRLPAPERPLEQRAAAETQTAPAPTHVLLGSTAYSLDVSCYLHEAGGDTGLARAAGEESQCALQRENGSVRLQVLGDRPVRLRGSEVRAGDPIVALAAGDSLDLPGARRPVRLIRFEDDLAGGDSRGEEA